MKRTIFVLLVIVALLAISMVSVAAAPPTDKGNAEAPEVRMGVFVDYGSGTAQAKPPYDDTEDDYRAKPRLTWASLSVTYYVKAGTESDRIAAINAGFQTWENDTLSNIDYTYGETKPADDSGVIPNNLNTVSWRSLGSNGPVAATYYWFIPTLKQIIEFDMVLNSDYIWSTTAESGKYDVQNVVTHEAGHTLVLYDLYAAKDAWLSMYGYTWLGDTEKRTLGYGDNLGVGELYPTP